MSHNLSATGRKVDALAAIRQQAAASASYQQGGMARSYLDATLSTIERDVNQLAGDDDTVSISASGHFSQADRELAFAQTFGVNIVKASSAGAPTPQGAADGSVAAVASSPAADRAIGAVNPPGSTIGGQPTGVGSVPPAAAGLPVAGGVPVAGTPPTTTPTAPVTPAPTR